MNSNNQYPIHANTHTFSNNAIYNYATYTPPIPQQPQIPNPLPNYQQLQPCFSIDRNNNLIDTGSRNIIMTMHSPGGTGVRMNGTNA